MGKRDKVRVRFRIERRKGGEVFAHLVDAAPEYYMATVYATIGQHHHADRDWLSSRTRKAKPAEYADLLADLTRVYSDCDLVVQQNARRRFPRR